jgi:luciferase family oxidoreductase group 1
VRDRRVRLSLLDFNWVNAGQSATQSLRDTFEIAKRADALGYSRFWIGEHHLESHASGSPQVLAGILGASTRRIRIGIGALLLYYASPLKVAEDFRLLETIFRGRMDLGVGRGRADNPKSHLALLDGRPFADGMLSEVEFQHKLDELLGHLRCTVPKGHPHEGAAVIPELDVMPEVWVCGAEAASVQAARTGAHFCCTLFHGRMAPPTHVASYRGNFISSRELPEAHAAIAVCGVCADTESEALAIREAFPRPNYLPSVVGTPQECRRRIHGLCAEYDVDEVVFLDIAPDGARRLRSLELLAQVFDLSASDRKEAVR